MYVRCDVWPAFYYKFTAESVVKKNIFKLLYISQSYGGEVDYIKRPVRRGTVLPKDEELAWDLTYGEPELL